MINYLNTCDDNMLNYYSNLVLKGVKNINDKLQIEDIPLIINTTDTSYPLAFIEFEDEKTMGINYTVEDGTERFVVINKEYITDIGVIYKQDIDELMKLDVNNSNAMYQ